MKFKIILSLVVFVNMTILLKSQEFVGHIFIKDELLDVTDIEVWKNLDISKNSFKHFGSLFFTEENIYLTIFSHEDEDKVINFELEIEDEYHPKLLLEFNEYFKYVPTFTTWISKGKQVKISYYYLTDTEFGFFAIQNFASQETYLMNVPNKYSEIMNIYKD